MPEAASQREPPSGTESSLGEFLRRARQDRGMSQDDLVRHTELSLSAIRKIEDGRTRNPGIFTVLSLWELLDLPLETLKGLRRP